MRNPGADGGMRLRIRRVFRATPARVFRAWTDPADLKRWWAVEEGWQTPVVEVDLRVGGRYRLGIKPPDGEKIHLVTGQYRAVIQDRSLVYTWLWEGEEAEETLVRVDFRAVSEGTEVTVLHGPFAEQEGRDRHLEGWQGCLRGLFELLASPAATLAE